MQVEIKRKVTQADLLITGVYSNSNKLPDQLSDFQKAYQIAYKAKEFEGKKRNKLLLFGEDKIKRLLIIGLGDKKTSDMEAIREMAGLGTKVAHKAHLHSVSVLIPELTKSIELNDAARAITEALVMASVQFTELKSKDNEDYSLEKITIIHPDTNIIDSAKQGVTIGEAVNATRKLCMLPGNHLTPTLFAKKAEKMAKSSGLKVTILDEAAMQKEKMGSLLSVSRGSDEEARFIILEHKPAKTKIDDTIVFVGKGLTFDAGGISLKPPLNMHEMKMDMSGGAAVFGALQAVAQLDLPVHVIGLIPSSENLINGSANKPGDVVTSMSGQTVEILNTDAEGRLILNDALTYAERFEPDAVIDLATLTGAIVIALGDKVTGMFGNNEALMDEIFQAGEETYERVWEFPLYEEYDQQLKSPVADLANIGGRNAGSITAAMFLSHFAENFHWAHLDIAGTEQADGTKSYAPKGSAGVGVRLLVQFLFNRLK